MAQRDQIAGALGRHDSGDARNAEHIALLVGTGRDHGVSLWQHANNPRGDRHPMGHILVTHIDHVGVPGLIEVRKF